MGKRLTSLAAIAGIAAISVGLAQVQSTYTGSKVEISFLNGYIGADREQMETLVKNFNASHPNIVVKAQAQEWGSIWQQLANLIAAGRGPDVLGITEDVVTGYMARNALTEITPTMLRSMRVDQNSFYKNLWQGGTWQGKLYGIPFSSSAVVMYYNKDLMKRFGIAAVPKTRAQMLDAARKCTTDTAGKHPGDTGFNANNLDTYGIGAPLPWMGGTVAYGTLRSNGADLFDRNGNPAFNTPEAVEAVQFMVDLSQKYFVSPARLTETADVNSFKAGKSCFNINGVWQITGYNDVKGLNYGIAFPTTLGTKQAAAWGAAVWMALPLQKAGYDNNKRAAAMEFIRWITDAPQNLYWTTSGALPTQANVAKDKAYAARATADIADELENLYVPTGFPWVAQVRGAWDTALENALLGKKPVKQALDDGVREAAQQVQQARQQLGIK